MALHGADTNGTSVEWSCRFRIVNETEQPFPPQNHATSHPNLLFADNKSIADGGKFNASAHIITVS